MNILKKISLSTIIALLALTISACGSNDTDEQSQSSNTSKNVSAFELDDQISSAINKTEMLKDLNAFFKEATLSEEDQQQIKTATLREATQRGRLPNYMAGETLASPAVLASAITTSQNSNNVVAQTNYLNSTPVYRFYNLWTNVHFYTASESERANVIATAPHFRNEGTAYFAASSQEPNTAPVYRFYNYSTGAHFYTINQAEKDNVIANLSQYYRFEGISYFANPNSDPDLIPVYRFYNFNIGAHFYTASSTERATVIQNFPFMRNEGIAYYVAASRSYTVGGAVNGLGNGKSVVLTLNGAADLNLNSNSNFTFGVALTSAQAYTVAVKTQPVGQTCSVANGSGNMSSAGISNVSVTCTVNIVPVTIGGSLSGLGAGKSVVLSLNAGSDLTLNSNTGFTFAGTILSGQTYTVTVKTQPPGQFCSVINGSGTVPVNNITNVTVSCINYVTVGGSVSGLNAGNSLTLRLNGLYSRTFTNNIAAYSFSQPILSGQTYSVLIQTQPVGQICSIANGTGTAITNVSNVIVTCVSLVKVGGTVTGLGAGKSITLTLNGSIDLAVTTSSFQFPTILTTGQLYSVVIKTQPIEQTCSITNGVGTAAAANVTNISIVCVNHTSVSGVINGLNAGISPVIITLNGGSDLQLTSNSSFIFLTTVPNGQAYSVVIKTQPIGQTCSVSNGNGVASGSNITNVLVSCANNVPTGLLISEVAGCKFLSSACWFEIYNPTNTMINISAYSFKTNYSYNGTINSGAHTFILPSKTIAPSAYLVIQGNPGNKIRSLSTQRVLINDNGITPNWINENDSLELISNNSNSTIDFVRWGPSTWLAPTTIGHWVGSITLDGINSTSLNASSIARPSNRINLQDTNSALDWINVTFPTPGGQNDIPANAVDNDNDGIPDSSELPGSTYLGMDLYSMGARQGVRDIFIEVDHMNSTDPGIIPRAESLQKVVDAFAAKGIAVHFDAGTQFSAAFSHANFNLGQGNSTVPYEACVNFDESVCVNNDPQRKSIYDFKQAYFDVKRLNIFHYMLFGDKDVVSGGSQASGRAELYGNDILITIGSLGHSTTPGTQLNQLINMSSLTMMHELGHNLGLQHGGNESINYKPNYYSIMNYLYSSGKGLAQSATSIGPYQRWLYVFGSGMSFCSTLNSACGSPSQFIIDYSNGTGAPLNEAMLTESFNIGRGADAGVYADWNGNVTNDSASYAKDINGTGTNEVLTDYNDWGNIRLTFARSNAGEFLTIQEPGKAVVQRTDLNPMDNDKQTYEVCSPTASSQMIQNILRSKATR